MSIVCMSELRNMTFTESVRMRACVELLRMYNNKLIQEIADDIEWWAWVMDRYAYDDFYADMDNEDMEDIDWIWASQGHLAPDYTSDEKKVLKEFLETAKGKETLKKIKQKEKDE